MGGVWRRSFEEEPVQDVQRYAGHRQVCVCVCVCVCMLASVTSWPGSPTLESLASKTSMLACVCVHVLSEYLTSLTYLAYHWLTNWLAAAAMHNYDTVVAPLYWWQ